MIPRVRKGQAFIVGLNVLLGIAVGFAWLSVHESQVSRPYGAGSFLAGKGSERHIDQRGQGGRNAHGN